MRGSVNLKKTMFVCTGKAMLIQSSWAIFSLNCLAISLSTPINGIIVFSARRAGPATTPGLLITPPRTFLLAFRREINYRPPTTSDPKGAQSPLLRQKVKLFTFLNISAGSAFNVARA